MYAPQESYLTILFPCSGFIILFWKSLQRLVGEILQQIWIKLCFEVFLLGCWCLIWFDCVYTMNEGLITASAAYSNFVHLPNTEATAQLSSLTLIFMFLCTVYEGLSVFMVYVFLASDSSHPCVWAHCCIMSVLSSDLASKRDLWLRIILPQTRRRCREAERERQ